MTRDATVQPGCLSVRGDLYWTHFYRASRDQYLPTVSNGQHVMIQHAWPVPTKCTSAHPVQTNSNAFIWRIKQTPTYCTPTARPAVHLSAHQLHVWQRPRKGGGGEDGPCGSPPCNCTLVSNSVTIDVREHETQITSRDVPLHAALRRAVFTAEPGRSLTLPSLMMNTNHGAPGGASSCKRLPRQPVLFGSTTRRPGSKPPPRIIGQQCARHTNLVGRQRCHQPLWRAAGLCGAL
jgi:hypothetical protein